MGIEQPAWLFLTVPLWFLFRAFPVPGRLLTVLRTACWMFLLLALSEPYLDWRGKGGRVILVADRSASMPADAVSDLEEAAALLQDSGTRARDQLGVVSFAARSLVEKWPGPERFSRFSGGLTNDASDLYAGLDRALSIVPESEPARILVMSDGRWTGDDPVVKAMEAAARGIAVDFRHLDRETGNDLAVTRIDVPSRVNPEQGFLITAWYQSAMEQTISYRLTRGSMVLAEGEHQATAGEGHLVFRDLSGTSGTTNYTLELLGADPSSDPEPLNNKARFLVSVQGPKPVLHVSQVGPSAFSRLLSGGGIRLVSHTPDTLRWSLSMLASYAAVVLENVPAGDIGFEGMQVLGTWIEDAGGGLLVTGGRQSLGGGGYFRSPLDALLPVSMESRQENRELSTAMVIALDRSGSMSAETSSGQTKMGLANRGVAEVISLLDQRDRFALFAVDQNAHEVIPLSKVEKKVDLIETALKVESLGGGIYVFEALARAARELVGIEAGTRHILLFADARDAEQPGEYRDLLAKLVASGITVSVVGLGLPEDVDGQLLREIATLGKGNIFFTERAEDLPRVFAHDTIMMTREVFVEEPTGLKITSGMNTITSARFSDPPTIGGYNLCFPREDAILAMVSTDENAAPITATRYSGSGRVAVYTGEVSGTFAGGMVDWDGANALFTGLTRWVAGEQNALPNGAVTTQTVRDGIVRLNLHLDPERLGETFTDLPEITLVKSAEGSTPVTETVPMQWADVDRLEVTIPLESGATVLPALSMDGKLYREFTPARAIYPPEAAPAVGGKGREALERLARATGGRERLQLADIWQTMDGSSRLSLAPWLLTLAILVFLAAILERRTALLSALTMPWPRFSLPLGRKTKAPGPVKHEPVKPAEGQTPATLSEEPRFDPEPAAAPALADSLRKARERARQRTR